MNITQVYLTPAAELEDGLFRVKYQNQTTYLQLFIEECLRKNKLSLGKFNRIVFEEGGNGSNDFRVVGNNALPVSLEKSYEELEFHKSDREVHDYFVRKYLEGFRKFDDYYSTSLVKYLAPLLKEKYKDDLFYEKKMAAKRLGVLGLQAVGRYSKESFKLIIKSFEKNLLTKSKVVFECEPDMFIVKYAAYKVVITDTSISIINKICDKTLELQIEEVI